MKRFLNTLSISVLAVLCLPEAMAQQNTWPREIPFSGGGIITIYQPQPESLNGNKISGRSAVSVKTSKDAEPVFGAIWVDATTEVDRDNRMMLVEEITVKQVKFPGQDDPSKIEKFKQLLEKEIPKWNLAISIDEVTTTLENRGIKTSTDLNTAPPKIIYSDKPATLVLIDGEPKLEKDKNIGLEKVKNTPFPIVKEGTKYYLFTGKYWYSSSSILTGWSNTTALPAKVNQLNTEIQKQIKEDLAKDQNIPKEAKDEKPTEIVVSTEPAELLQSDGPAEYAPLEGTSLLFVSNSPNDLFKDINTQKTFVLIAGRWYQAPGINGPWSYIAADKLPVDFSNIKEGGEKDNVLASVAGTNAANEAVLDAMIPQTATVDRKTATPSSEIKYDGTPQFERIEGTTLEIAVNTANTVMRQNGKYYVVENGIWFESNSATGPWRVATQRPTDVENIPASSPAYNTKYVEVYDVKPDVVVVGYTPGYLNSYVYGPTVVYGTGYPYNPWYGPYYYPRPVTWGFGMNYNPWTGWSFNWGFSWSMGPFSMGFGTGGFSFGFGFGFGYGYGGGWFGPPMYHPPYRPPYWGGGYYGGGRNHWGNNNINIGGDVNINIGGNQNIYNRPGNKGVTTRDISRKPGGGSFTGNGTGTTKPNVPSQRPTTGTAGGQTRPAPERPTAKPSTGRDIPKNVVTDKNGDIFKRDQNGDWNRRDNNSSWKPADANKSRDLDKMQRDLNRGRNRSRTFENTRPSMPSSRPSTRPASRPATRPASAPRRRG